MKSNLHKIADRGDKLEDIEGRAGEKVGVARVYLLGQVTLVKSP